MAQNILQLNRDQFADADFDGKVTAMITGIIGAANVEGFALSGRLNIGSGESDELYGTANGGLLRGGDGNDNLFGFAGNDFLEGGKGDDYLKGELGNDIYRFNLGDGQDAIIIPRLARGSGAANDNAANDNYFSASDNFLTETNDSLLTRYSCPL